jgi:putative acetyltransferase
MTVSIIKIGPENMDAFASIWISWLKNTIGRDPEAEDLEVMADPAGYYAKTGGTALLAMDEGEIVGGVAVKGLGASGFEFCKLIVTETARGNGGGRALVEACLHYAKKQGGPVLYLQSFSALQIALGLYSRMGFVETGAPPEMTVLARTEVVMANALGSPLEMVMR